MEELEKRIKFFGYLFMDRLDNGILQDDIDYVDYNEINLAFELICDHIVDFDISITKNEYEEAISLANALNINNDDTSIKYMKELVKT